jgi:DedD protein
VDTRIKERLTGALILVAALVILVPEVFSGRRHDPPAREAPPAAPATEGPPLRTYTSEMAASSPPAPQTAPAEPPAAPVAETPARTAPRPSQAPTPQVSKPTATTPAPVRAEPPSPQDKPARLEKPAREEKPVRETTHEDKPAPRVDKPPAAPAAGEWFVQVGSFSQAANAERYAQQLRQQGFGVVVLPPAGGKGLTRVRVGPARSREAAATLLERLTAAGHKGAVVGS